MSSPFVRWQQRERRALPVGIVPVCRYLLMLALVVVTIGALGRDLEYLRAIPGTVPIDDVFAYECYARAFWRGSQAVLDAPQVALCGDHRWLFWTAPPQAFHTLPREYPAPALAVFSLPLLWPFASYSLVYMVLCAVLVFGVTVCLVSRRLELCAAAFVLYVLVGGWATALARFDLVPSVLVLGALVLAERRRYAPAYLLLAGATLLKLYPGLLVFVLAAHQWRDSGVPPRRDLGLFALAVTAGLLPWAILNPGGLVGPLHYNALRPPQIESVAGSLLWLSGKIGVQVQVRLTYHSVNVLGPLASPAGWGATLVLVGGLLLACRRAWEGRDNLGRSFVLVLLLTLCGGKVLAHSICSGSFPSSPMSRDCAYGGCCSPCSRW